jgi:hypothetical protein
LFVLAERGMGFRALFDGRSGASRMPGRAAPIPPAQRLSHPSPDGPNSMLFVTHVQVNCCAFIFANSLGEL